MLAAVYLLFVVAMEDNAYASPRNIIHHRPPTNGATNLSGIRAHAAPAPLPPVRERRAYASLMSAWPSVVAEQPHAQPHSLPMAMASPMPMLMTAHLQRQHQHQQHQQHQHQAAQCQAAQHQAAHSGVMEVDQAGAARRVAEDAMASPMPTLMTAHLQRQHQHQQHQQHQHQAAQCQAAQHQAAHSGVMEVDQTGAARRVAENAMASPMPTLMTAQQQQHQQHRQQNQHQHHQRQAAQSDVMLMEVDVMEVDQNEKPSDLPSGWIAVEMNVSNADHPLPRWAVLPTIDEMAGTHGTLIDPLPARPRRTFHFLASRASPAHLGRANFGAPVMTHIPRHPRSARSSCQ